MRISDWSSDVCSSDLSGKFIAADAKRRVWCNRGSNPLTRNLQETVAGIMAESVVHHLQIVQIDDEQSPITRSAAVERAQRGVERRAIGKTSQRVRKGALPMHTQPTVAIERDPPKMPPSAPK